MGLQGHHHIFCGFTLPASGGISAARNIWALRSPEGEVESHPRVTPMSEEIAASQIEVDMNEPLQEDLPLDPPNASGVVDFNAPYTGR